MITSREVNHIYNRVGIDRKVYSGDLMGDFWFEIIDALLTRIEKLENDKAKNRLREVKEKAVEYMGGVCFDCKQSYPNFVYDFHHLDRSQKDMNPSKAFRENFEQTKKELDKCVMLCSNCHRIRHFSRGQNE